MYRHRSEFNLDSNSESACSIREYTLSYTVIDVPCYCVYTIRNSTTLSFTMFVACVVTLAQHRIRGGESGATFFAQARLQRAGCAGLRPRMPCASDRAGRDVGGGVAVRRAVAPAVAAMWAQLPATSQP